MGMALPSVSVVMATYNGAAFLHEQLASIAGQTYPPLELVVCDDQSTDATLDIIETFTRTSQLDIRLHRNQRHLGAFKNFVQAARLCRGDVIAFSDQDDIWRSDKLAVCTKEFAADPEVVMVMHSGAVSGTHIGGRPMRFPAYPRRIVATPASLPLTAPYPGFAQVFHRDLLACLDYSDDFIEKAFGHQCPQHDGWISFVAAAFGKVVLLPDDLVAYRQHEANLSGAPEIVYARDKIAVSRAWKGSHQDLLATAAAARMRATVIEDLAIHQLCSWNRSGTDETCSSHVRAAMWTRSAVIKERRANLYHGDGVGLVGLRRLACHFVRGDYGSRQRGGSGLCSLVRDVLHAMGLLEVAFRATKLVGEKRKPPSGHRDRLSA
jgi:hypothetical protein